MSLSAAMMGVGRPIAYYPRLARFFGSVNAAIFFAQLFYWQQRTENPDGVYKTSAEWERETGLSYREQATARSHLRERGFLKEVNRRLEHRIFYRLDQEVIDTAFQAWVDPTETHFPNDENASGEMRNPQSGSAATDIGETRKAQFPDDETGGRRERKAQFVHTEITTEITTENMPQALRSPEGAGFSLAPVPAKDQKRKPAKHPAPTSAVWESYSEAYRQRYGEPPVRNARVNGQLAQLVARLGDEAAPVAAFYVGHGNGRYVQSGHAVGPLLQDAEKLRTEWVTGRRMTQARSRQIDATETNRATHDGALEILRQKGLA